tara:strand:+ start:50 stop:985 length:936 start_codon:yes stop_codon:yes gene_type:complete
MCAPPIVIGIISAGLGFIQNQQMIAAQNRAIEVQNQNARAQFEVDKLQVEANRFREQQQFQSTELANQTSEFLANRAAEKEISSINIQVAQAQEEAAIKKREKKLETTRAKGEILATGKGGLNVVNLLADVDSQFAQYDWGSNRNLAFVGYQAATDKESANIRRASRLAQLNPYIQQTYIDPVKPIDQPKVPRNTGLALLSAGLQGASAAMSWSSGLASMGYQPPPTGNPWFSTWTKPSSILLKENIFKLGTSKEGHNVYKFNYKGNPTNYIGVIAEEVQKVKPQAVAKLSNGFLGVNYNLIDVDFLVQTT